MNKLGDLKFDTVKPDTSLAEEYLKKCNHEFHTIGSSAECDPNEFALDNVKNKVYFTQDPECPEPETLPLPQREDYQKSLWMLAKKLEENVELFAQLEYLIRKLPIDEVKNYDMKLLIQHIMYYCSTINDKEIDWEDYLWVVGMADDSPLSFLGSIVHYSALYATLYPEIKIEASPQTAAICHLFTQLCHEVGLNKVVLTFHKEPSLSQQINYKGTTIVSKSSTTICKTNIGICKDFNKKLYDLEWGHSVLTLHLPNLVFQNGGVGVVTECSDIDSAVDTFLHTPLRCPWRLSKIFVQESVYEQFKQTLRWKCGIKDSLATIEESLKSQCLKFSYKQKHFLVDPIDYITPLPEEYNLIQYILVEAYRTNKELLSLLTKLDPYCLSLWSSDYSEANEIAYGVSVPVVWINNFGTLDGPDKASQSFFYIMEENLKYLVDKDEIVKFSVKQPSWKKMSYMKRVEMVQKALKVFKEESFKEENDSQIQFANQLEEQMVLWENPLKDLIEIENGKICVVRDTYLAMAASRNFMPSLLQGTLIVGIEKWLSENEKNLINCFEKEQIPIKIIDGVISMNPSSPGVQVALPINIFCRKVKAVWSNFGTIFAN